MRSFAWVLTTSVLGVALAAAPDEHAGHHPPETPKSQAAPKTEPPDMMEQKMGRMHTLMGQIETAKDEAERRKLLAEHRRAMHEAMQSMMSMRAEDGGCRSMMQMQDDMNMMMGMMDQLMRRMDVERPGPAPNP